MKVSLKIKENFKCKIIIFLFSDVCNMHKPRALYILHADKLTLFEYVQYKVYSLTLVLIGVHHSDCSVGCACAHAVLGAYLLLGCLPSVRVKVA